MKISEILNNKKVTLSFEIFPPKKQEAFESVKQTALTLSALKPDFISITYGAGGSTQSNTSDLAKTVQDSGTVSLAHLTCVRSSPSLKEPGRRAGGTSASPAASKRNRYTCRRLFSWLSSPKTS